MIRTEALSSIIPYLDGQRKEEVMEKALDAASKIKDNYKRANEHFQLLFLNLDGQKKEEMMEKVLDTAFKIEDDYKRAEALLAIVPNLDGQRKKELRLCQSLD